MSFAPHFTITDAIAADLTLIERARGFLEAATLSEPWIREMGCRALAIRRNHVAHTENEIATRLLAETSHV